jgi:parvulin-like peptidyl-prolyl isomerase
MSTQTKRRALYAVATLSACLVTSGCGVTTQRELCRQYSDVVTTAQKLRQLDTTANSPEFVQKLFADFGTQVDQLQATAEGSQDYGVSSLQAALADARADVAAAANKADDQVKQLLQDDLKNIQEQWALVQKSIEVQCGTK